MGVRDRRARPSRDSTWSRKLDFLLGGRKEERRLGSNLMLHLSLAKCEPARLVGETTALSVEHRRPVKVWGHPRLIRALSRNGDRRLTPLACLPQVQITMLRLHRGITLEAKNKECCVLVIASSGFEKTWAKNNRHAGRHPAHIAKRLFVVLDIAATYLNNTNMMDEAFPPITAWSVSSSCIERSPLHRLFSS